MITINAHIRAFLIVKILFFMPLIYAGDLDINSNVDVNYFRTDNVGLTNLDEEKESIWRISPTFSLNYQSGRSFADADFSISSSKFSNEENKDENFQQIDSFLSTEILKNMLTLNLSHLLQQTKVGATQDQNIENFFTDSRTIDVTETVLQPVLLLSKNDIDISLMSSLSKQKTDNSDVNQIASDTDSRDTFLSITSNNASKLNWQVDSASNSTKFSDGSKNKTRSDSATIFYDIADRVRFNSSAGQDSNDSDEIGDADLNASFWSAGLSWTPNRRTNFNISTGERFNLKDDSVSASFQSRYTTVNLTSQREFSSNSINTDIANTQNQVIDVSNQAELRETNSLAISYERKKLQLQMSYQEEQNNSQGIVELEENDSIKTITLGWQNRSRSSIEIRLSQQDDEIPVESRIDQVDIQSITFNQNLTKNSVSTFEIRSQKRKSNDAAFNYNESGIEFSFTQQF